MLLSKLAEYQQQADTEHQPELYAEGPLKYIIDLDQDGHCIMSKPRDLSDPTSPRSRRGHRRLLPQVQRTRGIKPLLLASAADYTLGLPKSPTQAQRAKQCHAAYVALVERCAIATKNPDILAILKFLQADPLEALYLEGDFDPGGTITFQVNGTMVIDIPEVQTFWAAHNKPQGPDMQCLVCGTNRPAMKRLQSKIKGIPGGQTSGTSIISANSETYESYGLEASLTAPVCAQCAEGFTRGCNALLASESNKFGTRDGVYIFWTRENQEYNFGSSISDPQPLHVQALIESAQTGRWSDADEAPFYAAYLSGAGSRTVVRDWIDTTIKSVKTNLALWFRQQEIAPGADGNAKYYGLKALAYTTVRDPRDLPVTTHRTLFKSAIEGTPLPRQILQQALRRCQAESSVPRHRAALIKLALFRLTPQSTEDYMAGIDHENTEPGYLCGRLFAAIERTQMTANPNINATIVDRYYGTASTAPGAVFPMLLKNTKHHLSKIRREKARAYYAIEKEIEDITGKIAVFPKTLSLEDQGRFALGYYHQKADNWQRARENKARTSQQAAMDIQ